MFSLDISSVVCEDDIVRVDGCACDCVICFMCVHVPTRMRMGKMCNDVYVWISVICCVTADAADAGGETSGFVVVAYTLVQVLMCMVVIT